MKFQVAPVASATLLGFLLPFAAAQFKCEEIKVEKHTFDLSKLSGPHSVTNNVVQPPSSLNTTYTVDICKPLVPEGDNKDERCPGETQVCAIERLINPIEKTDTISRIIPIAGDFPDSKLNPSFTALSKATTSDQEGFRAILNGGKYSGRAQQAIIDFICDPGFVGTEGDFKPKDGYKNSKRAEKTVEEKAENTTAITFLSYEAVDKVDTLKLEWKTKYACENVDDGDKGAPGSGTSTSHWGFFTWFIIMLVATAPWYTCWAIVFLYFCLTIVSLVSRGFMVRFLRLVDDDFVIRRRQRWTGTQAAFMATAAYLIFGSWINYNRYGARGWEALPHSDTIQDLPYLIKDWGRSVFNTVQSTGTRGGYSAV